MLIKGEVERFSEFHENGGCRKWRKIGETKDVTDNPRRFTAVISPEDAPTAGRLLSHLNAKDYHMPDECQYFQENN